MNIATSLSVILAAVISTSLLPSDRLLFEMAGPRNGAMPCFSLAVGSVSETTRDVIFVSSSTYTTISSVISDKGSPSAIGHEPMFSVTKFRNGKPRPALFVSDKSVGDIMRRIILAYQKEDRAVPKVVSEIADSLPSR
jgi:hypothetical protein